MLFPEVLAQEEGKKSPVATFPEMMGADAIKTPFQSDPKQANLFLVRHTNTRLDNENRTHGWIDEGLAKNGQDDAETIARMFAPVALDKLYTSDLLRARQTASMISAVTGTPMEPTPLLRPINMGHFSGMKQADAHKAMEPFFEAWKKNPNVKIPGGESLADLKGRHSEFIKQMMANGDLEPGKNIGVVGHSMTERLFDLDAKNDGSSLASVPGTGKKVFNDESLPQYGVYHLDPKTLKLSRQA